MTGRSTSESSASNTTTNVEWRRLFLAQYENVNTRESYRKGLELFAAFLPYDYGLINDEDIIKWKEELANSGLSPATQKLRWVAVRSLYEWLVASQRLARNPFTAVKPPKRPVTTPVIATDAQVKALMSITGPEGVHNARSRRDRAIIALMWNGLRVSEITALDMNSLRQDTADGDAYLNVTGKGDKQRQVPLNPQVKEELHLYLRARDLYSQQHKAAMFLDVYGDIHSPTWGERMTRRQVQSAFDRAAKHTGVKGISPHALRHHYATRLIRQGVDVFSVQRLLGHSSVATTQTYVNLDLSDLHRATERDESRLS